jgi:uncharacterized protein (TIGR02271 family)
MGDVNSNLVLGKDGLKGRLLDPLPRGAGDQRVRIELATGRVIEAPASMLRRNDQGALEIPLGPADVASEASGGSASNQAVIPVLAEELHVGKQEVSTGAVRVHRRVHEHEETIDVPLHREQVDVRRVLVEREVDGPLPVRREGDATIIPIVEEVLVLSKKFVLKEEVYVTRSVREEHHRERVALKRQESEIERVDESGRISKVDAPAARATPARSRRPRRRSFLDE